MAANNLKAVLSAYEDIKSVKEIIEAKETPDAYVQAHKKASNIGEVSIHCHSGVNAVVNFGKLNATGLPMTDDQKKFCRDNGNNIKLYVFPELTKKVDSIYSSIRIQIKELSVGRTGNLIDAEVYAKELIPYLYRKKEELENIKAAVEGIYDTKVADFVSKVESILVLFPDKEADIKRQLSFIQSRTAKQYLDGIDFELRSEFPSACLTDTALQVFVEDMRKKYIEKEMISIYEGQLMQLWDGICSYMICIEKCESPTLLGFDKTRTRLSDLGHRIDRENVKGLPFLKAVSKDFIKLGGSLNFEDCQEKGFDLMAILYGHATQIGVNLSLPGNLPTWIGNETKLLKYYEDYLK